MKDTVYEQFRPNEFHKTKKEAGEHLNPNLVFTSYFV